MNDVKKTVGIMGGMGPMATVDLMNNIVSMTDAKCDGDHVHLLVDCDTSVPDRTAAILSSGESPLPRLVTMAKKLEYMGADIIAISCNTSHYFYEQICEAVDVPVINMIDEVARSVAKSGAKKALLLATDGTVKMKLYEKYLSRYGVETLYMNDEGQRAVMKLIYDCVKGGRYEFDTELFCSHLDALGAENMPVILGCTELPIAFRHFGINKYNTVDPTYILARTLILRAGAKLKN